jgi:transposase
VDVTAEVPVACYPAGKEPDPVRIAGVDLGIIHPYAVAGPGGQGLLVSGRAIRAEHRMHLADRKARARAAARRAPKPGQKGSRRWRHYRRRQRLAEARHQRRVRQAQHEAAKTVITWAVDRRVGALVVGDPRGVLRLKAGRRHNQRTRAAAPITAAPAGPLAGTGPPRQPHAAGLGVARHRRGALIPHGSTGRCT